MRAEQPSLFDPERLARIEREAAQHRADVGMERAASRAERVSDGWNERALEAVRLHAITHPSFLVEEVRKVCPEPLHADGRAWGAVIQTAKRSGWIRNGGFSAAVSSNLSPKVLWKSLIYDPKRAG